MILAAVVQSFGISSICHYKTYANSYGIVTCIRSPQFRPSEEEVDGVMFATDLNEDKLFFVQRYEPSTCHTNHPSMSYKVR